MAAPWEKYSQQPAPSGDAKPWEQYSAPASTPTPAGPPMLPPGELVSAPKTPSSWLGDVENDLREGGGRTFVGRGLGYLQGRGDKGYSGLQSGVSPETAEFMGSVPLGLTHATKGAAEIGEGHPFTGLKDLVSGGLQAATIPTSFVAPEVTEGVGSFVPTKSHAGQLLEEVRTAVNKPRLGTVVRPKGFLMPPEETIPLHEQPFTPGQPAKPIILNQADRATRPLLPAPTLDTPLSEKVDIFPNQLPHAATNIREPIGGSATTGLGHAEYVGEVPGTMGGRQPLQGVMYRRPPMSASEPPPPQSFLDNEVQLTRTLPLLEKAQRLSEEGHGTITPLDSLYRRINTINPLDYDEAFSRRSALGNLTAADKMRATPSLRAAAKQLHHAFGEDIGDVAERAGVGEQYRQGMQEYARAMQLRKAAITAAKYGLPLAGAGIAGHYLRDLIPQR